MSPLIDLQRRLVEVGRIRMGETKQTTRNGKTVSFPSKLETWRLTSRDKARLEAAAQVYGGTVEPWPEQDAWQVTTAADNLEVMILPGQVLSQWWELWSGGGCQRRCDGQTMVVADGKNVEGVPCMCPGDYDERAEQARAKRPSACKPTSRLSVLLPSIPGIGCWRLETHGYYAAVELAGAAELLERATASGVLLPARLRIDQRTQVRGGQTKKYPVPVLEVDTSPGEIMRLGGAGYKPLAPGGAPAGPNVAEALEATASEAKPRVRSGRAAAQIGPAEHELTRDDPIPVGDGEDFDLEV